MLIVKIAGLIGLGALIAIPLVACGGGVPDPSESANGAVTGAGSPTGGGSASGAAVAASAQPAPSASPPTTIVTADAGGPATPPTPGAPGPKDVGDDDDDDDDNGQPGAPGRIAVDTDCCFNGQYLRCPDANACMGGGDVNACFANCAADIDCFEKCADDLNNSGPPVGCQPNLPPPAGVDCANGQIHR